MFFRKEKVEFHNDGMFGLLLPYDEKRELIKVGKKIISIKDIKQIRVLFKNVNFKDVEDILNSSHSSIWEEIKDLTIRFDLKDGKFEFLFIFIGKKRLDRTTREMLKIVQKIEEVISSKLS